MHETRTRSPTLTGRDAGADRDHGADGFVAEDAAVGHRGHVALEDVQVGAADGGRVDPHDRVGVVDDHRVGDLFPGLLPGSVVDECSHGFLHWLADVLVPAASPGRPLAGPKVHSRPSGGG